MASPAKCDQVDHRVVTQRAALPFVVNTEVFGTATELIAPTIAS